MRIRNNTMALNTHRMYTGNNSAIAKSAEKLSSGYRVNRAGDDAAGLAISEKMRAQVRGLSMASKNSSDAISMVQTAEGALQEVHSMLQRMNELAVQAASDTNVTIDRDALQLEFQNLQQEIDQISQTTKFNDTVLLDGSLGSGAAQGGTTMTPDTANLTQPAAVTENLGTAGNADAMGAITSTLDATAVGNAMAKLFTEEGDYTLAFEAVGDKVNLTATINGNTEIIGSVTMPANAPNNTGADAALEITDADGNKLGEVNIAAMTAAPTGTAANGAALATALAGANTDLGTVTLAGAGAAAPAAAGAADPIAADNVTASANEYGEISFAFNDQAIADAIKADGTLTEGDITISFEVDGTTTNQVNLMATDADGNAISLGSATITVPTTATDSDINITNANGDILGTITVGGDAAGQDNDAAATAIAGATFTNATINTAADNNQTTAGNAAVIQVGAEAGHTLNISIEAITTTGLGIAEGVVKINGATAAEARTNASAAITATRAAINQVSTQRAQLGAMQNRLEYKINNLDTTTENLQAAESRIRDTDMAKEMSEFTKNNILSQAATAMLAQANAAPQNVLQLLG